MKPLQKQQLYLHFESVKSNSVFFAIKPANPFNYTPVNALVCAFVCAATYFIYIFTYVRTYVYYYEYIQMFMVCVIHNNRCKRTFKQTTGRQSCHAIKQEDNLITHTLKCKLRIVGIRLVCT